MEIIKYQDKSTNTEGQEIDLIVSRDCTLRCKYCYLQKKCDEQYDMDAIIHSFKKIVNECKDTDIVVGLYPEPWVNIDRTNELMKRALKAIIEDEKYTSNFMFSLGTNGVFLDKKIPMVEALKDRVSIAVTIDGIKEQHDKYRVFSNGSPSWDLVKNNIKKYQKDYNIYSTKVTYGPDTLQYIYQSSLFLWEEMNFDTIYMNVVFEDLWGSKENKEKLLDIYEEQISLLTDDIIKNKRWEEKNFKFNSLVSNRFLPANFLEPAGPYCGATVMRSIDSDGEIYPCFRMSPYALNEEKRFKVSNSEVGRTLKALNSVDTVLEKCRTCPLLSTCAMCVGGAFEDNNESSIYWRTTYHCEFDNIQRKYAKKLFNVMNPNITFEDYAGREICNDINRVCNRGF